MIGRMWRGDLPLDVAFWNWAVIGGLLVNIMTSIVFFLLLQSGQALLAVVVGYALSVPYNVLAMVGVWRSAGRYAGPPHWAKAARVVVLVGLGLLSIT
jgi:hypothetical protein